LAARDVGAHERGAASLSSLEINFTRWGHINDTVRSTSRPRFQVVEGDTVKFGKQLIHRFGIDAPEKLQPCDDGKWWAFTLIAASLHGSGGR
jgi:endonuclease YncB( thermonuclease family)